MSKTTRAALLAIMVVSSATYAQTYRPAGAFNVRDANGLIVGQYGHNTGQNYGDVNIIANDKPVIIRVTRTRLESDTLYFDGPTCNGNAFVALDPQSLATPAAFAPDGTLRIATTLTPSPTLTKSTFDQQFGCFDIVQTVSVLPTEVGPQILTRFTPPFSLVEGSAPTNNTPAAVPTNDRLLLGAIVAAIVLIAGLRLR